MFAAFQSLEDLRTERELLSVRPQAVPWLRYLLGAFNGVVMMALRCGRRSDCGWEMAATMTAGRAVAGVIDEEALNRVTKADKRLAAATDQLWELWASYAVLTDAERDAGKGDDKLLTFARLLPDNI